MEYNCAERHQLIERLLFKYKNLKKLIIIAIVTTSIITQFIIYILLPFRIRTKYLPQN